MRDMKSASNLETNIHLPSPLTRLVTQEIDELAFYMKHADIELIQIGHAISPSSLTLISFDNIDMQIGDYGAAYLSNASTDREWPGLVYKLNRDYSTICNGYNIDSKAFMFYGKNSDHIGINKGPCKWAYITFKNDYLETLLDLFQSQLKMAAGASSCLRSPQQTSIDQLYGVIGEISKFATLNPQIFQDADIIKGMEFSLIESQISVLSDALPYAKKNGNKKKKSHERIIRLSIDYLKANLYKPIYVLDLCHALNVGLRTLYNSFHEFYNISPIRYLRLQRYAKARRDLINADPKSTTVTSIAVKWHFWHFGRFSVEYKNIYGESPSESLKKCP